MTKASKVRTLLSPRYLVAWALGMLVTGAILHLLVLKDDFRLWVMAILIVVLTSAALSRRGWSHRPVARDFGWVPLGWLAIAMSPDISFVSRSTSEAAAGTASIENLIELGLYAGVALMTFFSWKIPTASANRSVYLHLAWPAFAFISASWSSVTLFSVVRSLQLFVPLALGMLIYRVWLTDPAAGWDLVRRSFTLLVNVVSGATLAGLLLQHAVVGRLAWPGADAVVAGVLMGASLTALIAIGRRGLNFSKFGFWLRMFILLIGLFLNHTRGTWIAVLLAALLMLWMAGRTVPLWRYVGVPYYFLTAIFAFFVARPELGSYIQRGERTGTISSLNNRVPLWEASVDYVIGAGAALKGLGYGAARVILPTDFYWAGNAHNAWIELFLGIGVIGLCLAIISLGAITRGILRGGRTGPSARLAGGMLVFLLIESLVTAGFALPGLILGILGMLMPLTVPQPDGSPEETRLPATKGDRDSPEGTLELAPLG